MNAARKMTLEAILVNQVQAFSESDRPAEIIGAHVEKLFTEVCREAFSAHGAFAANLKEELAKALPANLSKVADLPRYNDLIATALRDRWAEAGATGDLLRRAEAAINDILNTDFIPEVISLRSVLEAFVEVHQAKAADRGWHLPHVSIREGDGVKARYLHVFFDAEPESAFRERNALRERPRSDMEYANRLVIRVTGQSDRGLEVGEVISALIEGEPIGRNFSIKSKWQKLVACLYFGASKLILDCPEDDVTYD